MKPQKIVFGLAMAAATIWSFLVPDAALFQKPELARIFFFHFPCPMISSVFLFYSPYLAIRYLMTKDLKWDVRVVAANELGMLFGIFTMATGMLFSKVQWGAWWQWDVRQTSFLIVLLIYGAYFALRTAFVDDAKRASNSGAYGIAAALPSFFLIFVYPRLPQNVKDSFHPTTTIQTGGLKGDYLYVTLAMVVLFTVLAVWLYKLRVRAGLAELALETVNGNLENRGGGAAPTGVVRPVPVSRES